MEEKTNLDLIGAAIYLATGRETAHLHIFFQSFPPPNFLKIITNCSNNYMNSSWAFHIHVHVQGNRDYQDPFVQGIIAGIQDK